MLKGIIYGYTGTPEGISWWCGERKPLGGFFVEATEWPKKAAGGVGDIVSPPPPHTHTHKGPGTQPREDFEDLA